MLKRIFKMLKRKHIIKTLRRILPYAFYGKLIKNTALDEKKILFESQHGGEISGNMFYLLKELFSCGEYDDYEVYVTYKTASKQKIESILENYGLTKVKLVRLCSFEYMKVSATAKYLFNDNTFLTHFMKKEGQVYLNTWHGTPLKTLGKGIKNAMHNIGNTQRNFVCADYLLYPNRYTMEHMIEDYMIQNLATGSTLLAGYPRNSIFFDKERAAELREKAVNERVEELKNRVEPEEIKIYAYMPTWRGAIGNIDKEATTKMVRGYLMVLDAMLDKTEVLYVNLHPIASQSLNYNEFRHIKPFPKNVETYDFLNCTDCLVTDYSSVFFDYAVTGKKCILFAYDEEEYFEDRGVYMSLDELPFPKVDNLKALLREMRTPKEYDDTEFLKKFCAYECKDASKNVLDLVLKGKKADNCEIEKIKGNGKKNVLLLGGNLDRNGVTTSLYNLLSQVDKEQYNYYICFPAVQAKRHLDTLAALPEGVNYFPMQGRMNLTLGKNIMWYFFLAACALKVKNVKAEYIANLLKEDWQYEIKRMFGGAHFDNAIQFTGYVPKPIFLFSQFKDCNTTIYVHSDMKNEIETRGNQRFQVLEYAYKNYDNVALVTEDIWEPTTVFVDNTDNFKVAHNIIDYEGVLARSEEEIEFQENITRSNKEFEEIIEILNSDAKKIISVGRFSPEKDHQRMVDVFNKLWEEDNNAYFIIIGGNQYGGLYNKLEEYVSTLPCADNVILILSMNNPMPIVKACDGFILASHYEGFGLVLAEADILGLPVVSTDIVGPRTFMNKYNGTLVENSHEGVEEGFRLLLEGKVPKLTTDYKQYNENAINEFLKLLD